MPARTARAGRPAPAPRSTRKKTTRIEARLTTAQKALLQQAAGLRGETLTEFVLRAGAEVATHELERAGVVVLGPRDSAVFVEALLDPPAPGPRLRAAAERRRALLGSA
jgi:uncharacterized protein (DUF1778 family)